MRMSFTSVVAEARIAKIEQLLKEKGMTVLDLCAAVHITPRWGREYIRHLKEGKKVYIESWVRTPEEKKDHPIAVYRFGNEPDAERPEKKSNVQRQREIRERLKLDAGAYEAHLARRRVKRKIPYLWMQPLRWAETKKVEY